MPAKEKSLATENQYANLTKRLEKHWKLEINNLADEFGISQDPIAFVEWFRSKVAQRRWAKKTFYLYKSAMLWYYGKYGPQEAFDLVKDIKSTGLSSKSKTSSAQKTRRLKGNHLESLLTYLGKNLGKLDNLVSLWIRAGLYTGLRPVEWEHAFLDGATLTIKNAKYDEQRGNGEYRHLIFEPGIQNAEIECITQFIEELHTQMSKNGNSFSLLYEKSRKRLCYVAKHLWPRLNKRPTLYSTRHQFAANMKKSGLSKAEVAALMGHRSDETAGTHYAKTKYGDIVTPPVSPESEVASVLRKNNENSDAVNIKALYISKITLKD